MGFDFDGAEFTHVGNRVTFEVLLSGFGLETDPALAAIGALGADGYITKPYSKAVLAQTLEQVLRAAA